MDEASVLTRNVNVKKDTQELIALLKIARKIVQGLLKVNVTKFTQWVNAIVTNLLISVEKLVKRSFV